MEIVHMKNLSPKTLNGSYPEESLLMCALNLESYTAMCMQQLHKLSVENLKADISRKILCYMK